MAKKTYIAQQTGWLDGQHRTAGEELTMNEAAARYLVLNGQIKAKNETPLKAAAKPEAKAESERKPAPDKAKKLAAESKES